MINCSHGASDGRIPNARGWAASRGRRCGRPSTPHGRARDDFFQQCIVAMHRRPPGVERGCRPASRPDRDPCSSHRSPGRENRSTRRREKAFRGVRNGPGSRLHPPERIASRHTSRIDFIFIRVPERDVMHQKLSGSGDRVFTLETAVIFGVGDTGAEGHRSPG
jgi:hypothetical protein